MIIYRAVAASRAMFDGGDDQWHRADVREPTVYERESNSVKTGILDHRGNPIHAIEPREPAGFFVLRQR